MTLHEHEVHVAGGKARWAEPTGWRAQYGQTARADRKALVEAARARLATSTFAPSSEVEKQEVASSEEPSTSGDRLVNGQASPAVDGSPVRAAGRSSGSFGPTRPGTPAIERRPRSANKRGGGQGPAPSGEATTGIRDAARTTRGDSSEEERRSPNADAAGSTPAPRTALAIERANFIAANSGTMKVREMAAALGVTPACVTQYRQRLAQAGRIQIKHHLSDHREWTEAEDQFLAENIGRLSFEQLGAALNRTADSCLVRAKKGPIRTDRAMRKANRDTINASDVARILGQDLHFVERQLIAWGQLKAKKHEWLATNNAMQWAIRREDLIDFLLDYPWQYDRERITDPIYRRAADEAWNRDPLYTAIEAAAMLGFNGKSGENGHAVSSFLRWTAPKYVPREKLVVRRRGNPRATWSRSFAGMQVFVPRSTIRAIKASGWLNVRTALEDPNILTAEKAAALLYADPHRPAFISRKVLAQRARRFMESGAIPTKPLLPREQQPWMYAKPEDVLALKPAFFMREHDVWTQRVDRHRRRILERHEPELLQDPRSLALQQATGELAEKCARYYEWEQRAIRDLHWRKTRSWALVTPHLARTLDAVGPKTKLGGHKRLRIYHLGPCAAGLVEVPLWLARKRGLIVCEHCEFEAKFRRKRTGSLVPVVTCVVCRTTYRRGRGRPPKLPTCPDCRQKKAA